MHSELDLISKEEKAVEPAARRKAGRWHRMPRVCQGSAPPAPCILSPGSAGRKTSQFPKLRGADAVAELVFTGNFSLSLPPAPPPSPSLPPSLSLLLSQSLSFIHLHIPGVELPTVGSPLHRLATNLRKSLLQARRCPLPAPNPFPEQRRRPCPRLALCPPLSPACPLPPRWPGDHCTVERHVSIDLQSNLIGLWRPLDWFHS